VIFTETKLKGAFVIDLERRNDSRGFFGAARSTFAHLIESGTNRALGFARWRASLAWTCALVPIIQPWLRSACIR
jgi:hypothetical protein